MIQAPNRTLMTRMPLPARSNQAGQFLSPTPKQYQAPETAEQPSHGPNGNHGATTPATIPPAIPGDRRTNCSENHLPRIGIDCHPTHQDVQRENCSGDNVGVQGLPLLVPQGYVSGNPLSGTATYDNATFASLGITPGTYTWTWGTGVDSFTLQIGPAGVPDAGSTIGLLFLSLIGLFGLNRLRHVQLA